MTGTHEQVPDSGLTLYPSPLKHGLAALGALFFVVVGVVAHLKRHRIDAAPFLIDIAAYAGTPFFAACLGYAVYRLADWTQGSIAVTDSEIEEIWKRVPDGTPVDIRP